MGKKWQAKKQGQGQALSTKPVYYVPTEASVPSTPAKTPKVSPTNLEPVTTNRKALRQAKRGY